MCSLGLAYQKLTNIKKKIKKWRKSSIYNLLKHKVDNNALDARSFEHKIEIVGKTSERLPQPGNPGVADQPAQPSVPSLSVEVFIPLKYLSKFWKSVDLLLINCNEEFDLSWTEECVLIVNHNNLTDVDFKITSTKLYVSL